jgi:hypothetical protein
MARNIGVANGYSVGQVEVRVGPSDQPQQDPDNRYRGGNLPIGHVEVIIRRPHPFTPFSNIFSASSTTVTARAVARSGYVDLPTILVLDPTGVQALFIANSNGQININGRVVVNTSAAPLGVFNLNSPGPGLANIYASAFNFHASGYFSAPSLFVPSLPSGFPPVIPPPLDIPTPTGGLPVTDAPRELDPLRFLPTPSGGAVQSATRLVIDSTTPTTGTHPVFGSVVQLNPGTYIGGIQITGDRTVVLNPGTYIMQSDVSGGGFAWDFNASGNLIGDNVTIYNQGTVSAHQVQIVGRGGVRLTPPTTGPLKGVTIFQDRSSTAIIDISHRTGTVPWLPNSDPLLDFGVRGGVYAAGARAHISRYFSLVQVGQQFIVWQLWIDGSGALYIPGEIIKARAIGLVE